MNTNETLIGAAFFLGLISAAEASGPNAPRFDPELIPPARPEIRFCPPNTDMPWKVLGKNESARAGCWNEPERKHEEKPCSMLKPGAMIATVQKDCA